MVRCKKHGEHSDTYVRKDAKALGQTLEACRPCAKERANKYRLAHPERWREERAKKLATDPDYYNRASRKHRKQRRLKIISAYGGRCSCCGEGAVEFLTVDHIGGGGNEHRRTLQKCDRGTAKSLHPGSLKFYKWLESAGFPRDKYRLLCMNCNWSFGKWGYCPHVKS